METKQDIPDWLKDENLLMHFTKSKTAIENILSQHKLRFSPLGEMNDPYEYMAEGHIRFEYSNSPFKENIYQMLQALSKRAFQDLKIACFVKNTIETDSFMLSFVRPRLWAQYGDSQNGICLVFDKQTLLKNIDLIPHVRVYKDNVDYDLNSGYTSSKGWVQFHFDPCGDNQTLSGFVDKAIDEHQKDWNHRPNLDPILFI